ncbi:hypothetical protein VUR80DRAFT_9428 [Thermomyces stellatus]
MPENEPAKVGSARPSDQRAGRALRCLVGNRAERSALAVRHGRQMLMRHPLARGSIDDARLDGFKQLRKRRLNIRRRFVVRWKPKWTEDELASSSNPCFAWWPRNLIQKLLGPEGWPWWKLEIEVEESDKIRMRIFLFFLRREFPVECDSQIPIRSLLTTTTTTTSALEGGGRGVNKERRTRC